MTRDELEHIIRAAAAITDQYEFIIVGSQSILGPVPHPNEVSTVSMEADIYPCEPAPFVDAGSALPRAGTKRGHLRSKFLFL